MRVVALYRVSTDRQADEGASLDAQQREYRRLAKANDWQTVAEFRGSESATGSTEDRAIFSDVLQCIRDESPDAIWIYEQSRLTRGDFVTVSQVFAELQRRQVKLIIRNVIRDLASIDERFMVGIQSLVDRAESERIQERVRRGKRERGRQGKKNSGLSPYGYENPPPRHPNRGTLQVIDEQAAVVRRIYKLAIEGTSDRQIVEMLNADAIPSPRGGQWCRSMIKRILTNPVYKGAMITNCWRRTASGKSFVYDPFHQDAIVIDGAHVPIVTPELWRSIQNRRTPLTSRKPYLLTGLLHVNGVRYTSAHSRNGTYYGPARFSGDEGVWINAKNTDEVVWKAFLSLIQQPDQVKSLMEQASSRTRTSGIRRELIGAAAREEKLAARLERLIDMRADGEISKADFLHRTSRARKQLSAAQEHVSELRRRNEFSGEAEMERVVEAIRQVSGKRLTDAQRRKLLTSCLARIDITLRDNLVPQRRDELGRYTRGNTHPRKVVDDVTFSLTLDDGSRGGDSATTC